MSRRAALSLGSNLGDRLAHLRAGVRQLVDTPGVELRSTSSVYETTPVGGPDQGRYLNAVVVVRTDLTAQELLKRVLEIESGEGRVREEHWGPRTLDIDVLSLAHETTATPALTLPHPRAHLRGFVLVPWAEADPTYVVPLHERTVAQLLDDLAADERKGIELAYRSEVLGSETLLS